MAGINWRPDPARPPSDFHLWYEDFDFYLATNYVITETGSGTRAISQADNGILLITNAGADNDVNSLQLRDVASGQVAEHWKFVANKEMYFGCRFKISDATQSDFVIGLHITATTPVASAPTDGIWFRKDDGDRLIDFLGTKNSTSSTATGTLNVSGYMTDDTYTVLEFLYNGSTALITAYQDGIAFASVPLTNVVDDEELAISFAHQNGEAAAKSMSLDWIRVGKER